jgi:hypothetical protein
LLVKWFIWAVSLGSGASGGVLAPLLMMGGALGGLEMSVVERETRKFLSLVSLNDLLKARARHLDEERRRERTLKLRFLLPGGRRAEETETPAAH